MDAVSTAAQLAGASCETRDGLMPPRRQLRVQQPVRRGLLLCKCQGRRHCSRTAAAECSAC